jgi:hypothetical protein
MPIDLPQALAQARVTRAALEATEADIARQLEAGRMSKMSAATRLSYAQRRHQAASSKALAGFVERLQATKEGA